MQWSYPLDPVGATSWLERIHGAPPPPAYPFASSHPYLQALVPSWFYYWSNQAWVPLTFSLLYYVVAHSANGWHPSPPLDRTKGDSTSARLLRIIVIAHNASLCIYSGLTFFLMAVPVLDFFWQGLRGAGHDGLKLALCSIPTNEAYLARWAYLFYISKYYEVVDSIILYLKGKQIGNLQSYHHAGALISMWIAYRYQSQPVWVFCVFNSGVHTLMYSYYFASAMKLPFPKRLKRNLTTLQILQIASGTLLTNLYRFTSLRPAKVLAQLTAKRVHHLIPASVFSGAPSSGYWGGLFSKALPHELDAHATMDLSHYAARRAATRIPEACLDSSGSSLALHVNTLYMLPLLALFANFFVRSYLAPARAGGDKKQSRQRAQLAANGKMDLDANGSSTAVKGSNGAASRR